MNDIRFDPQINICTINGVKVPSVGMVMKRAVKALNPFLKEEVFDDAARARMDRGVKLHKVLEEYDLGTLDECEPWQEGYIRSMKAMKGFFGVTTWGFIEHKVAHVEKMYWGKLDRATGAAVYDIKTGKGRYPSYRMQVAGYCIAHDVKIGAVVYLPEDGVFVPERDIDPVTEADFLAFEAALVLARRAA